MHWIIASVFSIICHHRLSHSNCQSRLRQHHDLQESKKEHNWILWSGPQKSLTLNFRSLPKNCLSRLEQSCPLGYPTPHLTIKGHYCSDVSLLCASQVGGRSAYQWHGISAWLDNRLLYKQTCKILLAKATQSITPFQCESQLLSPPSITFSWHF